IPSPRSRIGQAGRKGILNMRRTLLLCALLLLVGCKQSPWNLGRWGSSQFGQGSIDRQKNRAVVIDPYPLNDIGPEVVGGRPREFINPLPEASRNELTSRGGYYGPGGMVSGY
ncbi:MAG: hypothetical protein ACK43N_20585, partial [Pirellulaceae bacterium]